MSILKLHSSTTLDIYSALTECELELPIISGGISAGFPSPALDFIDLTIDLNKQLIKHPSATFYGRVKGQSMKDEGIGDGDLLIIDKSLNPIDGKIAVCFIVTNHIKKVNIFDINQ
jgi:DNA polymerase V